MPKTIRYTSMLIFISTISSNMGFLFLNKKLSRHFGITSVSTVPTDLEGFDDEYLQVWTALAVDDGFVTVIQNEAVTVLRRADP